nr:hypothetical protein CFP56_64758 [Quercus suber]
MVDGGTLSCVSWSGGQKSQCMTTRLAEPHFRGDHNHTSLQLHHRQQAFHLSQFPGHHHSNESRTGSTKRRREDSLPQTRLVTSWRLVQPAEELEDEYGDSWGRGRRSMRHALESERREGVSQQDARSRPLLPITILEQANHRTRESTKSSKGRFGLMEIEVVNGEPWASK